MVVSIKIHIYFQNKTNFRILSKMLELVKHSLTTQTSKCLVLETKVKYLKTTGKTCKLLY